MRQLLDLADFWSEHNHFFVTEDTALGHSIAKREDTEFVPHFALGQARLGAPLTMLRQALRSAFKSLLIAWRRRPDYVITTGAGSQIFLVLWSRLLGAKIVLIDSFARFDKPSAFARLAGPFAHYRFSQSKHAGQAWNNAEVYDPLRPLETSPPSKQDLVFATVGATLPFPRLTALVLQAKANGTLRGQLVLQVGEVDELPEPPDAETRIVRTLPYEEVQALLDTTRVVICHGGTGSILTALRKHCRVIVIPRTFERGEHYDNHQSEIARSFHDRGLVLTAEDSPSLAQALNATERFEPKAVTTDYSSLVERLRQIIAND